MPVRNTCTGALPLYREAEHGLGLARLMASLGSIRTPAFTRAALDAIDLVADAWADVVGRAVGLPPCPPARLLAAAAAAASGGAGSRAAGGSGAASGAGADPASLPEDPVSSRAGQTLPSDLASVQLPPAMALLSGSFPLGRAACDVDLVLLCPPSDAINTATCSQLLATALQERGVELVYCAGTDARVARVVCRLCSKRAPSVEIDCSFAPMPTMRQFRDAHSYARGLYWDPAAKPADVSNSVAFPAHRQSLPAELLSAKAVGPGGAGEQDSQASLASSEWEAALTSVRGLQKSFASFSGFHRLSVAMCLDFLCAVLEMAGVKGAQTNSLRTFHVV